MFVRCNFEPFFLTVKIETFITKTFTADNGKGAPKQQVFPNHLCVYGT